MNYFSIPQILENLNHESQDKIAVIHDSRKISFKELYHQAISLSNFLIQAGIKKGDRVGICMNKSIDQVIVILAGLYSNSIFVPILPNLKHDNIKHIISDSGMKMIVTDSMRFKEIKGFSNDLEIFNVDNNLIEGIDNNKKWRFRLKNPDNVFDCISEDPAAIIYSSGSTGRPKGIVVSHKNIYDGAKIVSNYLGTNEDDKIIAVLSFNFDYGLNQIWQTILNCSTLYIYDLLLPNDFFSFVERNKITVLPLMPVIISRLFDKRFFNSEINFDLSSVRYISTSGGKVSLEMLDNLKRHFSHSKLFLMYGLTEAFRSTYLDPDQIELRPNSIGKAIPETEIYILDDNLNDCKPEEIGELVHRGGCIAKGYWNDEIKSKERFRIIDRFPGERVVFSGDLVKKDKEGFIYFVSRKDNMLKNSGIRISPFEIEDIVDSYEGILSSVAFGIENLNVGHDIVLVYCTENRNSIDQAVLISSLKKDLPFYMVPKFILFMEDFPITGNQGKIDRLSVIDFAKKQLE